jgi:hypothetical protein
MNAMHAYIGLQSGDSDAVVGPLNAVLKCHDQERTDQALEEIYRRWALSKPEGTLDRERYRTSDEVDRLLHQPSPDFVKELVDHFRSASQRPPGERHDFKLYMSLGKVFETPTLRLLRKQQGDQSTYQFLTTLVVDQLVDLEFSCLALQALVREFGIEGLLLDDRLPDGLFTRRGCEPHRYSVIDICAECIKSSAEDALIWGVIMLALYNVFEEYHRKQLLDVVAKDACTSVRARLVLDLLKGRLSVDAFEHALETRHA